MYLEPSWDRLPAVLLLVVALGLVLGAGWIVYDDFHHTYTPTPNDGTCYGDCVVGGSVIIALPTTLLAVGFGWIAVRCYRRDDARIPATVLSAIGAALGVALVEQFPGTFFLGGVSPAPVVIAVVVAAALTWLTFDRHSGLRS